MEAEKTQGKRGQHRGKRGPQVGREDVKGEILAAAREIFAARGFRQATIRGIAKRAEVDPKLIHYYFGSKSDLFLACIPSAAGAERVFSSLKNLLTRPDFTGEQYVTTVLETFESSSFGPALLGLLRGFGEHEESREIARRFFAGEILTLLAMEGDVSQFEQRIAFIGTQMYGLITARYVLQHPLIAGKTVAELAKTVGPVLDHYRTL